MSIRFIRVIPVLRVFQIKNVLTGKGNQYILR